MYCQITISVRNGGEPRHVWFAAWTKHHHLADLLQEIRDEGDCYVDRLETRPCGEGQRQIIGRSGTIQTRDSIVSVSELQFDLVSEDGRTVLHGRTGGKGGR